MQTFLLRIGIPAKGVVERHVIVSLDGEERTYDIEHVGLTFRFDAQDGQKIDYVKVSDYNAIGLASKPERSIAQLEGFVVGSQLPPLSPSLALQDVITNPDTAVVESMNGTEVESAILVDTPVEVTTAPTEPAVSQDVSSAVSIESSVDAGDEHADVAVTESPEVSNSVENKADTEA